MSDLNDPGVLFAAERTLLAWNRTRISIMVLGFVVERFGFLLKFTKMARPEAINNKLVGNRTGIGVSMKVSESLIAIERILMLLRSMASSKVAMPSVNKFSIVLLFVKSPMC